MCLVVVKGIKPKQHLDNASKRSDNTGFPILEPKRYSLTDVTSVWRCPKSVWRIYVSHDKRVKLLLTVAQW